MGVVANDLLLFPSKIYISFSNTFQTYLQAQPPGSVSSMGWEQLVRSLIFPHPPSLIVSTDPLFYDVFSNLSELHLRQVGMVVEWNEVNVSEERAECRWGQTRKYFTLPFYRLPVAMIKARQ
jgi:hypothetical protein